MRQRPPLKGRGILSGTGLIVLGLVATLAAMIFPVWSYADRAGTGLAVLNAQSVTTGYGPLSALDRDFITKVRLAGLWELPAGRLAQQKGSTDAVRTAGRHLVEGHTFLDDRVRDVAAQLSLQLPDEPTEQQRGWLMELSEAEGADFDQKFANILRLAHGKVFTVVAEVRAGTRNSLVRKLADDANTTVLDHITVLEATGHVDYEALARDLAADSTPPLAPSPAPPGPVADPSPAVPANPDPSPTYSLPPAASSPRPPTTREPQDGSGTS